MELPITDFNGGNAATIEAPDSLFARKFNAAVVHQATMASLAGSRLATRKQKTRAEVSHTTRKLFRQKGSGRARAGHSSTPVRRGGGRAFPASPYDNFQHKLPRRMFRVAMASVLSSLVNEKRLQVVRALETNSKKTRDLVQQINNLKITGNILLIDTDWDDNLLLAVRNIPYVQVQSLSYLLLTDLLAADMVMLSERSLKQCMEIWK